MNDSQDGNRTIGTFLCVTKAPLTYSTNDAELER